MLDNSSNCDDVTKYPTMSSLVRLKRTTREDDFEHDWNDNDDEENNAKPASTASSEKGSGQLDPMQEALACQSAVAHLERGAVVAERMGESGPNKELRGPAMRWNRKTSKAMRKLKIGLRVRLDCEVIDENDGEIALKVVGVCK